MLKRRFYNAIIAQYMDADGLVSPHPCEPTDINVSDNGTMFLAEFMVLLALRGELEDEDCHDYNAAIQACWSPGNEGLLNRSPHNSGQNGPDDMLGLAAGCIATGNELIAQQVIDYGWAHWGAFNNPNPGVWTKQSFLWRQPQLLCALYYAAGQTPGLFLRLSAALSIFVSCRNVPAEDTDPRRLAWLLIYCTQKSWLCRWASRGWFDRLFDAYGANGMTLVRAIYYHGNAELMHPFALYSVDEVS